MFICNNFVIGWIGSLIVLFIIYVCECKLWMVIIIMEKYEVILIFGKGVGGKVFLVIEKESGRFVL